MARDPDSIGCDKNTKLRLSRFSHFVDQHYRHFLAKKLPELGLGLSDYAHLLFLYHRRDELPQGASQTRLANEQLNDKAAVTRSVRKLENLGYVTVKPDEANSSRNLVSLTPAGAKAAARIDEWVYEWEESALASLDRNERAHFLKTFRAVFADIRNKEEN